MSLHEDRLRVGRLYPRHLGADVWVTDLDSTNGTAIDGTYEATYRTEPRASSASRENEEELIG